MSFHSHKYPQLNDLDWLRQKYVIEKQSTTQIAEILDVKCSNSIRQALLGNGLIVRTPSQGLRINNENLLIDDEIINGSLLGDGSIVKYNKHSHLSIPYFRKKNKQLDHIELVAKSFYLTNYSDRIFVDYNKCNGKILKYWLLRTTADEKLIDYYNKWYPKCNNYKKVIPLDLILTPKTILHWFLDDGSSQRRYRYAKYSNEIMITFSSESFTKTENEFLIEQLNTFSLCARLNKCNSGTGYRVRIPQSKSLDFFNLIGECPIESMKYKWKFYETQYEKRPINKHKES